MTARQAAVLLTIGAVILFTWLAITLGHNALEPVEAPATPVLTASTNTTARPLVAPPITPTTLVARQPTATARTAPIVNDATWDRMAHCESAGRKTPASPKLYVNWDDRRHGYEGGLHFMPSTWRLAGGLRHAAHAYLATRRQQIDIANAWLARTSWAQWPSCSLQLGLR